MFSSLGLLEPAGVFQQLVAGAVVQGVSVGFF